MQLPPAIIFINADINDGIKATLMSQLSIEEAMTDTEFDARVAVDPNYPYNVRTQGYRILVIRKTFQDYTNRELADIVMFLSHGQATIEYMKNGPPKLSLPIDKINIYELLRFVKSKYVKILPTPAPRPCCCCDTCGCKCGLGGIFAIEAIDSSGVHCANCDNEAHNEAFINRK